MKRQASDYPGKKALVVGLGDTGASCVRWLLEHDAEVRSTDSREAPPHAQHLAEAFPEVALSLGGFRPADFDSSRKKRARGVLGPMLCVKTRPRRSGMVS